MRIFCMFWQIVRIVCMFLRHIIIVRTLWQRTRNGLPRKERCERTNRAPTQITPTLSVLLPVAHIYTIRSTPFGDYCEGLYLYYMYTYNSIEYNRGSRLLAGTHSQLVRKQALIYENQSGNNEIIVRNTHCQQSVVGYWYTRLLAHFGSWVPAPRL